MRFAKHAAFVVSVVNSDDVTSHVPVDKSVFTVNVFVIVLVLLLLLILALQMLKLLRNNK